MSDISKKVGLCVLPMNKDHIKSKKLTTSLAAIAVVMALSSGCAQTVKTKMLVPAKCHEAAKLRKVAVLPFDGRGGNQVRADIEALLVGIRIKDKPYFKVIERAAIDRIVKEQSFQLSGAVDEETASRLGKLLGADCIILGAVTQSTEDASYSQKRSECASKNKDGKCTQRRKYSVSCTKRNAYFSFTPKAVNVTTGQIVASEVLSAKTSDSVCRDSQRALKNREELIVKAKAISVEKFREMVAPYYVNVTIKLLTKDDTKIPPEAKKKIKIGTKWSKQDRLDRACELWHEAYKLHPHGYAIPYLLGVCAELSGNLDKALSYYEKADRNTCAPVEEISEALGRIKVRMEKQRKIGEQMNR